MIWVGIDPGIKGAIACIHDDRDPYILPMPIIVKNDNNYYDIHKLCEIFLKLQNKAHTIVVEKPLYFSRQSTSGQTLSFLNYGMLLASFHLLFLNYTEVSPKQWQKVLFKKDVDSKLASVQYCEKNFRKISLYRTDRARTKDNNFSDALCLASYGKEMAK